MTVTTSQEQEDTVYNYLKNITGYINHKEVGRETGMDETQARSVIHRLISSGAVKRVGFIPGMGSRYETNPLKSMNTPRVVTTANSTAVKTSTRRRRRSFGATPDAKEALVRSRILLALERSEEPVTAYKIRTLVGEDSDYIKAVIRRMLSAGLIEGKKNHDGPRAKRYFTATPAALASLRATSTDSDEKVDYIGNKKFVGKSAIGTHTAQYSQVTRNDWQAIAEYVAKNGSIYAEQVRSILPELGNATAYNRVKQMVEMGILVRDNDSSLEQNTSRSRRYLKLADDVLAPTQPVQPEAEPEQESPAPAPEPTVDEVIDEASDAVVEANTSIAKTTAKITISIEGDANDPSVVAIIKALASR